ncbi:hypothetical protein ACFE04_012482 [Oxalis oulophora]
MGRKNIKGLQAELVDWSRSEFGNITINIRRKQRKLKELLVIPNYLSVADEVKVVENEINSLLEMEDKLWRSGGSKELLENRPGRVETGSGVLLPASVQNGVKCR